MKLINERYKIINMLRDNYDEAYVVEDLWNKGERQILRIIDNEKDNNIIAYYIDNFISMEQIKHKNLLGSYEFDIIKAINLKKSNTKLYFSTSEYINSKSLDDLYMGLNISEKLKIILDLMSVVDFLHFRGFVYKFLAPINILYTKENEVKLVSLSLIVEKVLNSQYSKTWEEFIAPEVILDINNRNSDIKSDYYSLGMIMKYLLCNDVSDEGCYDVDIEKKDTMLYIIDNLTSKDIEKRDIPLREHIRTIINTFNLDYKYDLKEERHLIFSKTRIVGREKELKEILGIDEDIIKNVNSSYGIGISGYIGSGKNRFLDEIMYRLKIKGKKVYKIDIISNDTMGTNNIANFLKQIILDNNDNLSKKYEDDFASLLPDLLSVKNQEYIDFGGIGARYKIFNRISSFISDITKENTLYVLVNEFNKANDIFISLIDYILKHNKLNKIFFILSYNDSLIDEEKALYKLNEWKEKGLLTSMRLNNFSEEDTGRLIMQILGMGFVPKRFTATIYEESKGNPGYISFIINALYNRGELFIGENGKWESIESDYSQIDFPSNFFDAIKNQLLRLDEPSINILNIVSLFNYILSREILSEMFGQEPTVLESSLNKLIDEKIIEEHIVEWGFNYNISNDELKRYFYWNLTDNEKLNLHRRASDILFKMYKKRVNFVFDELVFHLVKSDNNDLALDLIYKEINKINNRLAASTIALWETAYNIVRDDDIANRLIILDELTRIFTLKGNNEKLNTYLNELLELSIEAKSTEYEIKSRYYKTDFLLRTNEIEELELEIQLLEQIARDNNSPKGIIYSALSKSRRYLNNNVGPIAEIMAEAMDISEKYGIKEYMGNIHLILAYVAYLKGNSLDEIKHNEISKQHFEENNNPYEIVKPINNLGVIYSEFYGDIEKGLKYYEEGLAITSKYGLSQLATMFLNNIGELYLHTLRYDKALEYILESQRMAIEINDYNQVLISYINLGYISLITNDLENAYRSYVFLNDTIIDMNYLDEEIKSLYNNFLGEFYYIFGDLELSLKYSKMASEISKDFNTKEFLRAESRIILLNYLMENYIDKDKIKNNNSLYKKAIIKLEYLSGILRLCKLSLIKGDRDLTIYLFDEYDELFENVDNKYLNTMYSVLKILLIDSKQTLLDTEEFLKEYLDSSSFLNKDIELKRYLGSKYSKFNLFDKALQILLDAFDILYKSVKTIEDFKLEVSLIQAKNGDEIKDDINYIFYKMFDKDFLNMMVEDITPNNIENYFDLSDIINDLSKDEYNELIRPYNSNPSIMEIEDLLQNLNGNYENNLELILKFICRETFAYKGYILIEIEKNQYEIISNSRKDFKMPNELILSQALRNGKPLLISRKFNSLNKKYLDLMEADVIGIICAPIMIIDDKISFERRRDKSIQGVDVTGYLYLETNSVLNRFDIERCNLISSLINLIYLNIENKRLKLLSTTDKLTTLYTRKYFENKMDEILNTNKYSGNSFNVLMIDIDKFKNVNDSYGHLKGDEVLRAIGKSITANIRSTDIAGRYGGEEIIIILQNTTTKNAFEIGEIIRSRIESLVIPGIDHSITVSIGIAQYPKHAHFKEDLINKADQALYYAKENLGRNSVAIWNEGMEAVFNKTDKLYGILTGNTITDNRNILTIIETSELISDSKCYKKRAYEFLNKLLNTVGGEYAAISNVSENRITSTIIRKRNVANLVTNLNINLDIVDKVIQNKKGDFLIDWDDKFEASRLGGSPNWQSLIIVPMIRNNVVKGIIYITVPLREKEFSSNDFNIASVLGNIFTNDIE